MDETKIETIDEMIDVMSDAEREQYETDKAAILGGSVVTYQGRSALNLSELNDAYLAHRNMRWNELEGEKRLATASGMPGASLIEPVVEALLKRLLEPLVEKVEELSASVAGAQNALQDLATQPARTATMDTKGIKDALVKEVQSELKPVIDSANAAIAALAAAPAPVAEPVTAQ